MRRRERRPRLLLRHVGHRQPRLLLLAEELRLVLLELHPEAVLVALGAHVLLLLLIQMLVHLDLLLLLHL